MPFGYCFCPSVNIHLHYSLAIHTGRSKVKDVGTSSTLERCRICTFRTRSSRLMPNMTLTIYNTNRIYLTYPDRSLKVTLMVSFLKLLIVFADLWTATNANIKRPHTNIKRCKNNTRKKYHHCLTIESTRTQQQPI